MKEGKDLKTGCELFHMYLMAILNNAIANYEETQDQYKSMEFHSAWDYAEIEKLKETKNYYEGRIETLAKILEQYRKIVIGE